MLGKMLGDYGEGAVVKIKENGSLAEFYVAKHDYESALNGNGNTLLVRKYVTGTIAWNSTAGTNEYSGSDADVWLNGVYKNTLPDAVKDALVTTKIPYTTGYNSYTLTTLDRNVFLLSLTEYGLEHFSANVEGSALPIAVELRIPYDEEKNKKSTWTRTPSKNSSNSDAVFGCGNNGTVQALNVTIGGSYYMRPCFVLPSTTVFDSDTNELKSS